MGRAILGAFIIALVIKIFFLDLMIAEGHSMVPVIKPGSLLVVCKVSYGIRLPLSSVYFCRWAAPKKGEVVVFYTPSGDLAVKRCGENSVDGSFYALGDNGPQSYDSRSYGPVSIDKIIGRVLGIK